jgi:hypothetical protein
MVADWKSKEKILKPVYAITLEIIRPYVIPYIQQRPNPAVWCCEALLIYVGGKVYIFDRTDV